MKKIVDTNVLAISNTLEEKHYACKLLCIEELENIKENFVVVLDYSRNVIREYSRHAETKRKQMRVGDHFYLHVVRHAGNEKFCIMLEVNYDENGHSTDFPDDSELNTFDKSDRKFVSLALKSGAPIVAARDRGWPNHKNALKAHGVVVQMICDLSSKTPEKG